MASPAQARATAESELHEHEHALDALHRKVSALRDDAASHERLEKAAAKYKAAHKEYADDVLGIVGSQ